MRSSGTGANRVHTRERHTATTGALASSSAIACILEPAEQWAECDKTAGCDTEAGFDVGPDGDVGGCVWGSEELLGRPLEMELLLGKLTQKVRILIVMKIRNADNDRSTRNTAHAQNTSQGSLCSYVHLEIPDKEDGQKSQDQITARGGDTVDIGHIDDRIQTQTVAMDGGLRVQL